MVDTRQHDEGFDDWGLLGLLGLLGLVPRKTREVHVRPATEGVNRELEKGPLGPFSCRTAGV